MDQTVHCSGGRTPYQQGVYDASSGLSAQDTSNQEYLAGYDTSLQDAHMEMRNAGQKPAACLL